MEPTIVKSASMTAVSQEADSTPFPVIIAFAVPELIHMQAGVALPLTDVSTLKAHPLLATAVSKLQWGHRHLAALETNIADAFADPDNCAVLRADRDVETGRHSFRIRKLPDLFEFAENFVNSISDITSAYRSALDKFAWKAACANAGGTPRDPRGVKFPFADTQDEWINQGRARNQFDPRHCGFIEGFQPKEGIQGRVDSWHGPYVHQLTLLHELSNDDKHRDSWPVFLVSSNVSYRAELFPSNLEERTTIAHAMNAVPIGIGKTMESGLEVVQVTLPPSTKPEIDEAGSVAPAVAFPEGRTVIPTLQRLERFVHLILSEFARQFP